MQQGKNYCSSCAVLLEEMFPPPANCLDCFEKSITCTLFFSDSQKQIIKHANREMKNVTNKLDRKSSIRFLTFVFEFFEISYLQHYTFSWRFLCMAPKHGRNRRQLPFNYLPFFCLRA